ncbi:MAG: TAT-variant-translocated molybdopterin oxidoreductase [Acidobacteriia bacterium]|nr:TAT-variant-translocated molybdopterin oxidoreductase [Terriglobia bacterium]
MSDSDIKKTDLDFAALRERLRGEHGREFWRSLDELADTPEFESFLHSEFPRQAGVLGDGVSRRQVLKLMGASLALAGLTGCAYMPKEKILPYVRQPEELVPGKPLFYATTMPLGGYGKGVVVESHMGRPTKVEGNTLHPASLGATDVFAQASVLTLYDPDRSQTLNHLGLIEIWANFSAVINQIRAEQQLKKGAGLRILTGTITSPTLAYQLQALLTQFPMAKWHQYEPIHHDHTNIGAQLAFGEHVDTQYRFDQAEVILSLDSDFLYAGPAAVRYARDFANKRRMVGGATAMNRLYVVEGTPSITGSMADHRLRIRSSEVQGVAQAIAARLGVPGVAPLTSPVISAHSQWIGAVVRDLERHRGACVVSVGEQQPPSVHALGHAINLALGNAGKTVTYTGAVEAHPVEQLESLRDLVTDMKSGRVDALVILGGNPAFNSPPDISFIEGLLKVKVRVHLGLYEDETSNLCHWHIPETHYLESWGDVRSYDGTISLIQPLIAPLFNGKSPHEILALLLGQPSASAYQIVQEYWKNQGSAVWKSRTTNFKEFWETSLHDGVITGTALPLKTPALKKDFWESVKKSPGDSPASGSSDIEVVFRPDPTIWDGRFANNGWLQELPKPLSKLTWDNVAWISPRTAERLSLQNGNMVELKVEGHAAKTPIWIMPGHADDSITVFFGYGRWLAGRVGSGTGFNMYALRNSKSSGFANGVALSKTGELFDLACTQNHHSMEGRDFVRTGTLAEFRKNPRFIHDEIPEKSPLPSLYPSFPQNGYQWGMAINLNSCIGCNACVVACQAENNSPVVGKEQVQRGREMHWIRIDRYYDGDLDAPQTFHEPVMCMQCENAPCEVVCPVGATNHSSEGLNQMVYNRCVGTRYCSNNCPYKVRRFNFLQYEDWQISSLKLQRNPNVTVRSRGVMEKCTYCVQRINAAKIQAEEENRPVRDGEIQTACQAACPTQAIVFGNINDPESEVSKLKGEILNYGLLTELTTHPRTTYIARLRNPNPEIETE